MDPHLVETLAKAISHSSPKILIHIVFTLKPKPMKKLFYVLIIAVVTSLTVTSCTEEQVEPKNTGSTLGGNASEGK